MRQASSVLNSQIKIHAWFNSVNWRRMEAGRVKPPFEPDPHAVYAKVITCHLSLVFCQLWLIRKEKKGIFKGSQYELCHLVIHNIFLKYFHALPLKISWIPSKFESQAYLSFGREFPIVSRKIEKRLPILNLASKTSQRDANFQSLLSACQLFQRIWNSGCFGHRAVFDGEGGEPWPRRRELLLKVQQWSCFNTLAGGNYWEGGL